MLLSAWTDGLQSNLLAEFTGLVCSIIATYLVVDRLIDANRKRHHRPLRDLLNRAAGQNTSALAHLWAYEFELVGVRDLEASFGLELPQRVENYMALIDERISALESSTVARDEFIKQRDNLEIFEIARETFENVSAIGDVAGRVSQVVLEDLELQSTLADLEAEARNLDHVRSFSEYVNNVKKSRDLPLDLVLLLSLRAYRGAQQVWQHLNRPEKQG